METCERLFKFSKIYNFIHLKLLRIVQKINYQIKLHSKTGDKNFDKLLWIHSLMGFFDPENSMLTLKSIFFCIFLYPICLKIATENAVKEFQDLNPNIPFAFRIINVCLICVAFTSQLLIRFNSREISVFISKCVNIRNSIHAAGIPDTKTSHLSKRLYKIRIFMMLVFLLQTVKMTTEVNCEKLCFLTDIHWITETISKFIGMIILTILAKLLSSEEILLPTAMVQLSDVYFLLTKQVEVIIDESQHELGIDKINLFSENLNQAIDLLVSFNEAFKFNVLLKAFSSFLTVSVSVFILSITVSS